MRSAVTAAVGRGGGSIGSVGTIGTKNTIDLEIFVVKIFSWFSYTMKIENTKYILQLIIITVSTFRTRSFTSQLASYFVSDGLFDTYR